MRLIEDVSIGLGLLPSRRPPEQRFRLESKIGQGGMGCVYEATDLQLSRKVAIKLISETLVADSAMLDRFEREARILAGFQHPNVVTLFDAGVMQDGRPFLVMERLQGRTLREELKTRGRLSGEEVRSIVRQICAGLSAAHRRSLIHRDLKPENIFLCDYETERVARILDFGLSKLLESRAPGQYDAFSTLTGHVVGTPAYLSPELLAGAKPDFSCDIWALAVITCELLTGERRPGGNLQHIPHCWREFFNCSLAQEQRQRPETVSSFLEQFERCAATSLPEIRSSGSAAF
jgi:serine/threonine-protein kinase